MLPVVCGTYPVVHKSSLIPETALINLVNKTFSIYLANLFHLHPGDPNPYCFLSLLFLKLMGIPDGQNISS